MTYAPDDTWDLDSLLPGGVEGDPFEARLDKLRGEIDAFTDRVAALPPLGDDPGPWADAALALSRLDEALSELKSLAFCAAAADTRSTAARLARSATHDLGGELQRAATPFEQGLGAADPTSLEALLEDPSLADHAPWLRHLARGAADLQLEGPLEELAVELEREALHGWGQLYDLVSGELQATLERPGEGPETVGINAVTALRSHPEPALREAAFTAGTRAWRGLQGECALALTHLTGARQTRYDRLGIDALTPSLHDNRVGHDVLDALWEACEQARPSLLRYLERKARLLGKDRLDWFDLYAPLPGAREATLGYDEAQDLVVDAFARCHDDLAGFARHALASRWVEAEARDHKRQGAFCTGFPLSGESRVFLTWSDSLDRALTLAHELGHAYHGRVLFEQPHPRRQVTSALAETASTFAEAVVRDAALAQADSESVRLFMLDQQLQAGVTFLMNIPARFHFERRLYDLRREGAFDPAALSELMVACQRESYGDALATWNPLFWASKLHFYISSFGFYNWPYTFGYLFSSAVYARARAEGEAFWPDYVDLLRRTGWQRTEHLARDALGEDLTDVAFWQRAMAPLMDDLHAFLAATE